MEGLTVPGRRQGQAWAAGGVASQADGEGGGCSRAEEAWPPDPALTEGRVGPSAGTPWMKAGPGHCCAVC
jgi:hypothetical protein